MEEIAVELVTRQTTPGYVLDAARGFVTWTISLAPNETKNLDLGSKITLLGEWKVGG